MKTSEQCNEIFKAVSVAQGEMNPASKSTVNPFYKSTYSNLSQVWDAIREPLSKNGISVFQDVITSENGISVVTRICHSSGQWMEFGPLEIPLAKKDAQSVGSAISYGKRYSLSAAIGVVSSEEDDDGEKAMDRSKNSMAENLKVAPKPASISKEQVNVLTELFKKCPSGYQEHVIKYLKSQDIDGLQNLPVSWFGQILFDANTQAKKAINGQQPVE